MIKAGIVGGTGYTGVELLRILALHSQVTIHAVTSRTDSQMRVDVLYPSLRGYLGDLIFCLPTVDALSECDVVFFATPNGTAMLMAEELLNKGIKVIDLSADFRLKDVAEWEKWYGMTHSSPRLVSQAVYGLPELHRDALKNADLIACAGCYPTAVQLGFAPLLKAGVIDATHLIADVKSGVSGAGRKAEIATLMSETGESFKSYGVSGHRHLPEIAQGLKAMTNQHVNLTFVPHLTPMIRGIHATLYASLTHEITQSQLQALFEKHYADENFVDVLPQGSHPDTRNVRGSNRCQIAVHLPQNGKTVVVLSVIDNLVKGAAGQAVQAMNLRFGFHENHGLSTVALYP
jgi:N-acetyl-gamma-glutamyl-phosphate reductase